MLLGERIAKYYKKLTWQLLTNLKIKKMKRILFLLLFIAVTIAATAQERIITLNNGNALDLTSTKWFAYNWSGTLDNLIPTTRDTIDIVVMVKNQSSEPLHFYASLTFSPITTADTTIAITVQEKKFNAELYTDIISSALTPEITAKTIIVKTSLGVVTEHTDVFSTPNTTRTANTLLYYKYLRFRLILKGDDKTGTGIMLNRFEIQFFN